MLYVLTRDEHQPAARGCVAGDVKTVVYVTHNVAEAVDLADRVVVMMGASLYMAKIELPIELARRLIP